MGLFKGNQKECKYAELMRYNGIFEPRGVIGK
jgi:hypothetical protein